MSNYNITVWIYDGLQRIVVNNYNDYLNIILVFKCRYE